MAKNRARSYDFAGWATKNDIICSDGRTIRRNAFIDNDGKKIPIVWNHQHNNPNNILGHALLENRNEGVYFYGYLNSTEGAHTARDLLKHGDIDSVSIYANDLKHVNGGNVVHGDIKELSLVIAGANSGAKVCEVLCHSDTGEPDECYIRSTTPLWVDELKHSDDYEEEEDEEMGKEAKVDAAVVFDQMTDEQKQAVYQIVEDLLPKDEGKEDDFDPEYDDEDYDGEDYDGEEPDDEDDYDHEEDDKMGKLRHNAFDDNNRGQQENEYFDSVLTHSDEKTIIENAFNTKTSLKQAFSDYTGGNGELCHAALPGEVSYDTNGRQYRMPDGTMRSYGIQNAGTLFPEAKTLNVTPEFIARRMDWVQKVMGGVKKVPFSRIKTVYADVTEDTARALGYQTGKYKKEEVFSLLKRSVSPTTIFKKQKMDRDDISDITSFDVVAWIKAEMRMLLEEEIARAILIGDGRSASSEDKISETNIIPIAKDTRSGVFGVPEKVAYSFLAADDEDTRGAKRAKAFIKAVKKTRKDYRGSGNPTLFCSEDTLTDMLLLEDGIGRPLYDTIEKLKTALRVSDIVTLEQMSGLNNDFPAFKAETDEWDFNTNNTQTKPLLGIIVNLSDYAVGADKGGAVSMFDDFDIDYNQMVYLIETRCSGMLTKAKSALIYGDFGTQAVAATE